MCFQNIQAMGKITSENVVPDSCKVDHRRTRQTGVRRDEEYNCTLNREIVENDLRAQRRKAQGSHGNPRAFTVLDPGPRNIAVADASYQSLAIPARFYASHPLYPSRAGPYVFLTAHAPSLNVYFFRLPFVQASHSWRPASLNISPLALFIVGLELGSLSS